MRPARPDGPTVQRVGRPSPPPCRRPPLRNSNFSSAPRPGPRATFGNFPRRDMDAILRTPRAAACSAVPHAASAPRLASRKATISPARPARWLSGPGLGTLPVPAGPQVCVAVAGLVFPVEQRLPHATPRPIDFPVQYGSTVHLASARSASAVRCHNKRVGRLASMLASGPTPRGGLALAKVFVPRQPR